MKEKSQTKKGGGLHNAKAVCENCGKEGYIDTEIIWIGSEKEGLTRVCRDCMKKYHAKIGGQ